MLIIKWTGCPGLWIPVSPFPQPLHHHQKVAMVVYTLVCRILFTTLFSHQFQSHFNKISKSPNNILQFDRYLVKLFISSRTSKSFLKFYHSLTYFQFWSHHSYSNNISDVEMELDSKLFITKNVISPFRVLQDSLIAQCKTTLSTCRTLQHTLAKVPTVS